jgi:uncharacterized membrane protein YeiB
LKGEGPVHPPDDKRIETLDYLRGFALLGIILVNILPLLSVGLPVTETEASYWKFLYLFIEGRFFTIFSFLFGVGFYLFITKANQKGRNGRVLFLRRILVMFLIGLIHFQFHPGEALTVYAISGLLVFPFYRLKKETNLIIALSLLGSFSWLAIKPLLPIPLILLGFAAGQFRLFENLAAKKKPIAIFTAMMGVLSLLAIGYQNSLAPRLGNGGVSGVDFYPFFHAGIMVGPIVSAFYAGSLILLVQRPFFNRLLSPLKHYGRMALTNYLTQTVFIFLAGRLFGTLSLVETLYICLIIYTLQLLLSYIWLRNFIYGPLEWLWRAATYLELPPLRRRPTAETQKS